MRGIRSWIGLEKEKLLSLFWNVVNYPILKANRCVIGDNFRPKGRIRIRCRGRITVGNDVSINSSIMANPLGGNVCTILVAQPGASIQIGDRSGISNAAIFASKGITIGNDVMIGAGVKIYDSDFHPVEFAARQRHDTPKAAEVIIEDGAFIGAQSIILKGVTIGRNSVVGAGSVVTKRIPENQVWAGNPAHFIRGLEKERTQ